MTAIEFLIDGRLDSSRELVLAHGAGAPMDSPFMDAVAAGVAEGGIRVVRFEFPYMAERRNTGKRKPPGSPKRLLDCWRAVVQARGPGLVIGGKSMGGRLASMVADELEVRGLVCLGYPFHPPGRPEKLRTDHLRTLSTPSLFVQGERDALGNREEVDSYELSEQIRMLWLPDGDHSFKPRKSSGHSTEENLQAAVAGINAFIGQL